MLNLSRTVIFSQLPERITTLHRPDMHEADALPLTFSVAAKGYKSAQVKAQAGFYRVDTKLALTQSPDKSQIEWVSISPNKYRS